jgi:hypothetical protein
MNYYKDYKRRLVGGIKSIGKHKIKPGQILTFNYTPTDSQKNKKRTYIRIVFVLSTWRDAKGVKLHALSLEEIPWTLFIKFIKNILIKDTISLLKRRYQLVSPVREIVNRPKPFYVSHIKKLLTTTDSYRTYKLTEVRQPKVGYLNFRTLFGTMQKKDMLISRQDKIEELRQERIMIESTLGLKLDKISDRQFENIIIQRFGSVKKFVEVYRAIEEYAEVTDNKEEMEDKSEELL